MKKILLTVSFMTLLAGSAFAQSKAVKGAEREAKQEAPKFDEARNLIKGAMENAETKGDAKTYYVAGFVETRAFEIERNKMYLKKQPSEIAMYSALYDSYGFYEKAAEIDQQPNEKGKVKPKYLKKIVKAMEENHQNLINGGAYFFDTKHDYQKAYDFFMLYLAVPELSYMAKDQKPAEKATADSITTQIKEFSNIALSKVYQEKIAKFQEAKDTVNIIKTLEEGADIFKSEIYYVQNLINMYIYSGQTDKALDYLDQAIASDKTNAPIYWNVKGSLYENQKDEAKAIECYGEALKLNSEYVDALESMGRMYYNQAVMANDEVSKILDEKEYKAQREIKVLGKYKEALPYFEKAHSIQPEERRFMVTLNNIYYNLNDGAKMKEMEEKMSK